MKIIVKILTRIAMIAALLLAGFAAGFPIGQSVGFSTGSEWVMFQADILAREAGLVMPINYEEGTFRVVVKQRPHLYKQAWKQANRHDAAMHYVNMGEKALSETSLMGHTHIAQ
jgi:hypothetical protein